MNISILAIKRSVFTYLVIFAFVLIGIILFSQMSVSYWPDFSAPVLLINTVYPGASAAEVEDKLTALIEQSLAGVSNVDEIESTSAEGYSSIMVRFLWGVDIEKAAGDIREKIDFIAGELPREALKTNILKVHNLLPPSYQFTLESTTLNEDDLKKFFDEKLAFYFLKLKDVASVEVSGGRDKFVAVEPIPGEMRRQRVSVESLVNLLSGGNLDLPAGIIRSGKNEFILKTKARLESLQEVGNIRIAHRGNTPIFLRDVAKIRYRFEAQRTIFKFNGKRILGVSIRKKSDGNAVSLSRAVQTEIRRIKELYPQLIINTIKDESEFIRVSIKNVIYNALLGGLLAGFVIFLFLGSLRKVMIIILSIPASICASFVFMRMFGLSINTISLGGLAMAVGMIVDASIVMLENIERNLKLSPAKNKLEVFQLATAEVVAPITASILTSIVVFLPLAFLKGIAAVLLGELALTVVFTLSISLIISLTLIPLTTYRWVGNHEKYNFISRYWREWVEKLQALYEKVLQAVIKTKKRAVLLLAVMFVVFFLVMGLVGQLETEMIPEPDEGEFRIEARFSPSTALETTKDFCEVIRLDLAAIPDIEDIYQVIGESMTYANPEANVATFFILLKEKRRPIDEVIAGTYDLLGKVTIPGFSFKIIQSSASEGMVQPDLDVLVYGDDLDRITEEAAQLLENFKTYKGLSNLDLSIKPGKTELQFIPRRDRLSYYGLPVFSLATRLRAHYEGIKAGKLKIGEEDFDIKIIYPDRDAAPHNIDINTYSGLTFKLKDLVDFSLTPTPAAIKRMNQQRFAEIKADLAGGGRRDLDKYVASLVEKWRDKKDVRVEKKRVSAGIAESFQSMGIALMLSIFLVYVVMGSQFNSFKQPFIISFTVPLGIIGVILILWLTRTPLNLNSFLGGVVLVGIVVNNGILLVDFINRKLETMKMKEAIVEGSILRMRPILMTALTTILGMLPLAIGWGKGSEALAPLARAVIGGLTFSTITTLLVIPALYLLLIPRKA